MKNDVADGEERRLAGHGENESCREREREEYNNLQTNTTVLPNTRSLSWDQTGELTKIRKEYMDEVQCSMEKKRLSESLLNEFKIEALGIVGSCNFTCNKKMEILDKNGNRTGKFTYNAKGTLYKKFNPEMDKSPAFRDVETGELYASIYARILIRKV